MADLPGIGDIVDYALNEGPREGEIRPAIVVRVAPMPADAPAGFMPTVGLRILTDGGDQLPDLAWAQPTYSEQAKPGCWSWPPKA